MIKSKNSAKLVTTVSVVTFGFDALRLVIITSDAERLVIITSDAERLKNSVTTQERGNEWFSHFITYSYIFIGFFLCALGVLAVKLIL